MVQRQCEVCGVVIPAERLEILPDTTTCTAHSSEEKRVGFNVFSHKTAPALIVLDPTDKESVRLATRANNRSR